MNQISLNKNYDIVSQILNIQYDIHSRWREFLSKWQGEQTALPRVIVVGAASSGLLSYLALERFAEVIAVVDNSESLEGLSVFTSPILSPVRSPEKFTSLNPDVVLYATSVQHYELLKSQVDAALDREDTPSVFLFAQDSSRNEVSYDAATNCACLNLNPGYSDYLLSKVGQLAPYRTKREPLAIYGAGLSGMLVLLACRLAGVSVQTIVDKNQKFSGQSVFGVPISSFPLKKDSAVNTIVVSSNPQHYDSILAAISEQPSVWEAQLVFDCSSSSKDTPFGLLPGYTFHEVLGAGSEGVVYRVSNPKGEEKSLKYFHLPIRSEALERLEEKLSHVNQVIPKQSLPPFRLLKNEVGEIVAIEKSFARLKHPPRAVFARPDVQRANLCLYLHLQAALVETSGSATCEWPNYSNVLVDNNGHLVFADIGHSTKLLEDYSGAEWKDIVLRSLFSFRHGLFAGLVQTTELASDRQEVAQRALADAAADGSLQPFLVEAIEQVLAMEESRFADGSAFIQLRDSMQSESELKLSQALLAQVNSPLDFLPPNQTKIVDGEEWLLEGSYQHYLYRKGEIRTFGSSSDKFSLLRPFLSEAIVGKSFFDIGCNTGACALEVVCAGARHGTGIDMGPHLLMHAERVAKIIGIDDKVTFANIKLPDPNFAQTFDTVAVFSIIHHLFFGLPQFSTFRELIEYLSGFAKTDLFIEYIGFVDDYIKYQDPQKTNHEQYSEESFQEHLKEFFEEVQCLGPTMKADRILYRARHRK